MQHAAHRSVWIILAALLLTPPAALSSDSQGAAGEPSPRVVEAGVRFGFDLYREVVKENEGRNIFLSPTSVAIALWMTANGAGGETLAAIQKTLGAPAHGLGEINATMAALLRDLQESDPRVQVHVANSLWARKGLAFKKPFLDLNRTFYGAEVTALDFLDPSSPGVINDWVKERTRGRIPAIVDRIDPQHVLFLLNAIYFKGFWTKAFEPKETRSRPFTLPGGDVIGVPMMNQSGRYAHLAGDGFEAVSLTYGEGRFAVYLFLPAAGSSLDRFERALTADAWSGWMGRFTQEEGSVALPRFKIEFEAQLKEALSSLGMAVAFDPLRADFGGMLDARELFINQVKHKAFVEVNEEGTEAAAATSVEIMLTSARPAPFRIAFDRPFFFAIRDNRTGAVLFLGSVLDPRPPAGR